MDARTFAAQAHGDQRYGSQPYSVHLEAVVAVLRDHGFAGGYEDAGWLHDTLEDTAATVDQIRDRFGYWVARVVIACTGVGHNRKARNAWIYEQIGRFPEAAVVKVADRIANVEAAKPGTSHAQMYLNEAVSFHDAVACRVPDDMRKRLNRAYAAIAMEARQGGDAKQAPSGTDDSAAIAKTTDGGGVR
jgi:(p)ppGpp synthase/HD superfamily hydrolase